MKKLYKEAAELANENPSAAYDVVEKSATHILPDARFEEMLDSIIKNANAMKAQVARLGGLEAARQRGHNTVLASQVGEIASVCRVLSRLL